MKWRKLSLWGLGIGVVAFLGALGIAVFPTGTRAIVAAVPKNDAKLIERGRYLAVAGDCTACHTVPGHRPFAGGRAIHSPIGAIYTTNITPDPETGIGTFSLDDFDRSMRHGIMPDGSTLYPAMPYPSYARITDDDIRALYAYFRDGVAPVRQVNRDTEIPWPLSMRWPLGLWRKMFAPDPDALPPLPQADAATRRGAYLVQGLGHCGSCHTPRRLTMQEAGLDERSTDYLAGGALIDGWVPINLRGDRGDGMGAWTARDIATALRDARNDRSAIVGAPMVEVVEHSMQHLTAADRFAIARYMKTLPPAHPEKPRFEPDDGSARALRRGIGTGAGVAAYLDSCAGCHRTDGAGYRRTFPALAGNPTVLADDPSSLIRIILAGSHQPSLRTAPSALAMPGFSWRMDDAQVAALAGFVRSNWGNHAGPVTPKEVRGVRTKLKREDEESAR